MSALVEQALYGYKDGHRLIASSMSIAAQPNRSLRSLTDMAFDGEASSYLTCFPLPDLGQYALVKSWPAPEVSRPGAVWSHVLLIDFVDLGSLEDLAVLMPLFVRPEVDSEGQPRSDVYERGKKLPGLGRGSVHRVKVKGEEQTRVLWAAYGEGSPGNVVQMHSQREADTLLFAVWTQQWPRLRRSFAFRSRYRATESREEFDLQLVERLHRNQGRMENLDAPAWLERLAGDLTDPDPALRAFLRRYGAESDRGKADLPALVRVWLSLEGQKDIRELSAVVCSEFRKRQAMRQLKLALFGALGDEQSLGPGDELERLKGILAAQPASALNLDELRFRSRLDSLWKSEREEAVSLLCDVTTWRPANRQASAILLDSTISHVLPSDIPVLAASDDSLALAIIAQRLELLRSAVVWRSGESVAGELLELTRSLDAEARREVLVALLKSNLAAAGDVLAQEPHLWWEALIWGGEAIEGGRSFAKVAGALENALESVGPGSVGSAPSDLPATARLLLAIVSSPSFGLWRQIPAHQWAAIADSVVGIDDLRMRSRGLAVLIAATGLPATDADRTELWLKAFGPLHALVGSGDADDDELRALEDILPKPSADWQTRLREGLVKEVRKDRWSPPEVEEALEAVPAYRQELLQALKKKKKGRKSWVREVVDFITP